jgi:hypothetical protein
MRDIRELCRIWWRYVFLPMWSKNFPGLKHGGTSESQKEALEGTSEWSKVRAGNVFPGGSGHQHGHDRNADR